MDIANLSFQALFGMFRVGIPPYCAEELDYRYPLTLAQTPV